MNSSTNQSQVALWAGRALSLIGHLCAIAVLTVGSVLVIVPHAAATRIGGWILRDGALLEMTQLDALLHVALCTCMWAFMFLIYSYARQRMRTVKKVSLRTARGTIITETLIVLPLFMLMFFGMSQLVVNSIAGVLMNVAAFQSARSYWIWQPEEGGARAGSASATTKAQIAAAAVMTPVAPGDFLSLTNLDGDAEKLRLGLASANIPFAEVVPSDTAALLADLASLNFRLTTRDNLSFWRALDSQSFAQRSVTKFTHAYYSTSITPQSSGGRLGVKVTYKHNQVMPLTGRLFGSLTLEGPGNRPGYYATYERTYTYKAQVAKPNSNMPAGNESGGSYPTEGDGESGIRGGVADGDF